MASGKRRRYSPRARKFITRKIRTLAREGMPAPRRIAASLSMARARGLKVPRKPNAGVPEEGANEHIRNALAILLVHREVGEAFTRADVDAVEARLRAALRQLEKPRVNTALPRVGHRGSVRRRNPALAILGNPARDLRVEDATVATWAKIEYVRPDDPDGKRVVRVHEFKDGFEIGWLSDGSVQLSHPKHPLWMEDGE